MSHFAWAVRIVVLVFGAVGCVTALFFYQRLREYNPRVVPQPQLVMLFVGVMCYAGSAFLPVPWSLLGELVGLALLLPWVIATMRSRV
ncbi:MAG: hypothetical protein KGM44_01425 [bacterium]|nr:hypothetical protein [bacterium]